MPEESSSSGPRQPLRARLPQVPRQPGVYLMRDRLGKVIYVGKARDLRARLSYYFRPTKQTLANLKTRALIDSIAKFEFHTVRTEAEALLLEGKLIKDFRPRYNISFRDDKRFLLLKLRQDVEFPRFELTRQKKPDSARYFGPFAHSGALRATIQWLNRRYGLRSCRPLQPGEADYRHCSADIIRNCSAPCIGRISAEDYRARLEQAVAVLEGREREPLTELRGEMEAAAARLDFEKAAQLRDALENIERTVAPARRFTRGKGEPLRGNPLEAVEQLQGYLRLPLPPRVLECFDISNVSSTYAVASMVRFVDGRPDNQGYRRYRIKTVEGQNDFAAMAEVVRRRYSRILRELAASAADYAGPEAPEDINQEAVADRVARRVAELREGGEERLGLPDLIVVDGGKGQLSSAVEELRRLGLHEQPVIGLAKQEEEIYRPGIPEPLRIPHDQPALKLLQRLRDEAHRTANGYHQLLASQRVRESLLDAVPGLGPKRKQQLLQHFGSVERIRRAGAEEIAKLPGFSQSTAQKVLDELG